MPEEYAWAIIKKEASQICRCFDFRQVLYEADIYEGQRVTKSRLITSKRYGIVSKMAFDIYACNHDLDTLEECRRIDAKTYCGMNILDYLVGKDLQILCIFQGGAFRKNRRW
ncbi:MAG: hypothetical protein PUE72_04015 [Lachnospiraceae bacterium]|nr:hypothetical protein [Lachnospiraceae bacterium]